MKYPVLIFCIVAYVTSAQRNQPMMTFNLTYVDGTVRHLSYPKRDYSQCMYSDITKDLICEKNVLYTNVQKTWTLIPESVRYVRLSCLRNHDNGDGGGSGFCICKSRGTGNLATETYSYCQLTSFSKDSFMRTNYLEALDLSHNQLTQVDQDVFVGLNNVKYISFSDNPHFYLPHGIFCDTPLVEYLDLSDLPADVFPSHAFICKSKLGNLEAIDLSHSRIKDVPAESLDYLPSLKSLNLGGNELVEIYKSSFSGGVSLQHLNLSDNVLKYLFPYFCDYLPKLTTLHLRANDFDNFQFDEISNCSKVEKLDLSSNRIQYLTGNTSSLVSLKTFNISHNIVTRLNFSMASSRALEWFDASMNDIISIKSNFLASHDKLRYTNLSRNYINDSDNFAEVFKGLVSMITLDMSYNKLTKIPGNSFQDLSNLTTLYLDHNEIEALDANTFNNLASVEYLHLSHNKLKSLPRSIFVNTTSLRHVTLSFNALTSIEGNLWPPLETLTLNNNFITQISTVDFSKMEKLDLSHNKLSQFVGSNENTFINFERILVLDLSYNDIYDISSRLFQSSKNLSTLNLEHNQLSFDVSFEFLSNVKNLTSINLAFNNFTQISKVFSNSTLTKIETFNISNNALTSIDRLTEGSTSSQVKVIDMSNCQLKNLSQFIFLGLPDLELVDITNNNIETFPALVANDHTLYDFTDNPIVCACNMSWLTEPYVDVQTPARIRIPTHNYHVPFCKVYTESHLSNPNDLYRRQFMCLETENCDRSCSCYKTQDEGSIKTVICRNDLSVAPSTISTDALTVFLDGNMFVSEGALSPLLSFVNMSAKELYLNQSGIRVIDPKTLHGFHFVETLSLARNGLKSLPSDVFRSKENLKELYLNDNMFTSFESGVFDDLPFLKELDLSGNKLVILSPPTLSELSSLHAARYFFLADNPWSCNCSNVGFKDFIDFIKYKIRDRRNLYCAGTMHEMLYLSKSSFACLKQEEKKGSPTLIAVILVAVLFLAVFIAVLAYFRREVLSLMNYHIGCRIPGRKRLSGTHFDCYVSYDPQDQHCSNYVQKILLPKLRNNGYSFQSSNDVIPDVEVTRKVIEDSRCALCVIDKNFTTNQFCVNVLKMCLQQRKLEKRFSAIFLILGDIDLLALQPDVLKRLKKGDYVTARSRLWWQRLVYELPKPSGHYTNENDNVSESDAIVFSSLAEDVNV